MWRWTTCWPGRAALQASPWPPGPSAWPSARSRGGRQPGFCSRPAGQQFRAAGPRPVQEQLTAGLVWALRGLSLDLSLLFMPAGGRGAGGGGPAPASVGLPCSCGPRLDSPLTQQGGGIFQPPPTEGALSMQAPQAQGRGQRTQEPASQGARALLGGGHRGLWTPLCLEVPSAGCSPGASSLPPVVCSPAFVRTPTSHPGGGAAMALTAGRPLAGLCPPWEAGEPPARTGPEPLPECALGALSDVHRAGGARAPCARVGAPLFVRLLPGGLWRAVTSLLVQLVTTRAPRPWAGGGGHWIHAVIKTTAWGFAAKQAFPAEAWCFTFFSSPFPSLPHLCLSSASPSSPSRGETVKVALI